MNKNRIGLRKQKFWVGQKVVVPEQTFVGIQIAAQQVGIIEALTQQDMGAGEITLVSVALPNGDVHEYFGSMLQPA